MKNINLIALIFFFLCFSKTSLSEKISIVYTVDNDPITNLEIKNEITYLKLFNEKIREMENEALVIYATKSVLREKIKKIEVAKSFKLGMNEEIINQNLEQFIIKLGLKNQDEYFDLLKQIKLTNDFVRNKIEVELLWNRLIYEKYKDKLNINKEKIKRELKVKIENQENKIEEIKLYEILFSANSEIEFENEIKKIKKSIDEIGFENTARIFSISNSASNGGGIYISNGIIRNCNISGNVASSSGGGVYTDGGWNVPKIINCTVRNNQAGNGGGLFLDGRHTSSQNGSVEVLYSTVKDNISLDKGGGIYIYFLDPTLRKTSIMNNQTSGAGGGVYIQQFCDVIMDTVIVNNNTANEGGGIYWYWTSTITLSQSNILNNSASSNGGGLYAQGNLRKISNFNGVIIYGNSAEGNGGGIYNGNETKLNFTNSFVSSNISDANGGGFFTNYHIDLSNSFIGWNSSTGEGGAIYYNHGDAHGTISNTTITNNYSLSNFNGLYISNGNPTISGSNITYHDYAIYWNSTTSTLGAENNYWGSSTGPYNQIFNSSGLGDTTSNYVDIDPWLTGPSTDAPPIPAQNTTITSTGNDFINLTWYESELGDLAGYKLYFDTDSSGYPYDNNIDVGNVTSYSLSNLPLGTTYYFAVTTYDTDGNESWYSNEVTGVTRVIQAQNLDMGFDFEDLLHLVTHDPLITFRYFDSCS
mgnify:CR=1 FL=1